MKKLSDEELMDMLDQGKGLDSLSEEELAQVDDAKLAMMALQAWEEAEPIQAGEDFWPKLREKLPARPPRSAWKRAMGALGAWVWPSHSPALASIRVAVLVAILALASFWFAPQRANNPAVATTDYDQEQKTFIQRSLQKHDNYVTASPSDGSLEIPAGDASADTGESDPSAEYVP